MPRFSETTLKRLFAAIDCQSSGSVSPSDARTLAIPALAPFVQKMPAVFAGEDKLSETAFVSALLAPGILFESASEEESGMTHDATKRRQAPVARGDRPCAVNRTILTLCQRVTGAQDTAAAVQVFNISSASDLDRAPPSSPDSGGRDTRTSLAWKGLTAASRQPPNREKYLLLNREKK